ncbi:MAG: DNA adenine methylase [Pseudomonadota bacterium]|nr:DNA adenine methylase [Pseudomonadota bacterium]
MRAKARGQSYEQLEWITPDPAFPSTRFQGSKLKIVEWIWEAVKNLDCDTVLDLFGGTGSVGYMFKKKGKLVTYNDILRFNWHIALALIENSDIRLTTEEINYILNPRVGQEYPRFVHDTFRDIYYTDEENLWIDMAAANIRRLENPYKQSLAYFALFQSCISKRPFNLFHRRNLYLRQSNVERNFGNKTTWDKPFEDHFRKFIAAANGAVFSNGRENRCLNKDAFDIEGNFDLVYIDTPYISRSGVGVDYLDFYHFLEGLAHYDQWPQMINHRKKHKCLKGRDSITVWTDRKRIKAAFDRLFEKFPKSILVVSYRSDGIPSLEDLTSLLKRHKKNVQEVKRKQYKYVLSAHHAEEILLIGS